MSVSAGPRVVQSNLLMDLDMANEKQYPGSGANVTDVISSYTLTTNNAAYCTISNGTIQFTRSAAPPKEGGGMRVTGITGALAPNTFFYNDFTWEIWIRIDDATAGGTAYGDATEGGCALAVYDGYHAGFFCNSTWVDFIVWDTGPVGRYVQSFAVGASATNVIQGTWNQLTVTKTGSTFTRYLNGVINGTPTTFNITIPSPFVVNSNLNIGKAYNAAAGAGSYLMYSKSTFAINRMYNKSLTSNEVAQNFASTRGRFGI